MKLPYLASWDKTPITVNVTDPLNPINDNGGQNYLLEWEGKCNFTGTSKTVRMKDGSWVNLGGVVTIKGDIAPQYEAITGTASVGGIPRNIHSSNKVLNPDGSVNHIRLELL